MKNKIINVIEIIIEIVAFIVFFTMNGTTNLFINGKWQTMEGAIYKTLNMVTVYAVVFYVFWALNLIMCILSAISGSKKKDSVIHCILPILMLIITDWSILSFTERTNNFGLLNLLMFALIIVSFVKRSNIFVDEISK